MPLLSANSWAEALERDPTASTSAWGTEFRPCTNCLAMAPVPSIPHRTFPTTSASLPTSHGQMHKPRCYTLRCAESIRGGCAGVTMYIEWVYVYLAWVYLEGVKRGVQEPRKDGCKGQRTLPGVHDVRWSHGRKGFCRHHGPRYRRGHQLPRHGERVQHRRQRGGCREGAGAKRQARHHRARDQGARYDGRERPKRRG